MDNGEALYSDKIAIDIGWDASSIRDLKAGDYFTFDLPASLKTTITSFSLPNEENVTVANAVITPKDGGGYTVKVTFNDYVNGKQNTKGFAWIQAEFGQVTMNAENTFSLTDSLHVVIKINNSGTLPSELVAKWGAAVPNQPYQVEWNVRLNHKKEDITNCVVTETFTSYTGTEMPEYNEGSFVLQEVQFDETGKPIEGTWGTEVPVNDKVTIDNSVPKFTANLGNIGNKQYYLKYKTTYVPGTTVKNSITAKTDKTTETKTSEYKSESAGGGADAENLGRQ